MRTDSVAEKKVENKHLQQDQSPGNDGTTIEREQLSNSRRRLLKNAVMAAPVILTVASRPVWARNCTLSGQLSGNLSDQDIDSDCGGEGCTPGYWKNHPQSWSKDIPEYLMFDTVFGTNVFPGMTLGEVIGLCSKKVHLKSKINLPCHKCVNQTIRLGFHAVAAIQNAATAVKYDLTVEDVIAEVQSAYKSGSKHRIEALKDRLDSLNNQYCPGGGGPACGHSYKLKD